MSLPPLSVSVFWRKLSGILLSRGLGVLVKLHLRISPENNSLLQSFQGWWVCKKWWLGLLHKLQLHSLLSATGIAVDREMLNQRT